MCALHRIRRTAVAAALCGSLLTVARAEKRGVWLEIPGSDLRIEANEAAMLKTDRVGLLRVHLRRQPDEVAYSKITTWVNAASANIVTTQRGSDEGIICTLDLSENPGLTLHPGRNSVEVTYKDRWNEAHYTSFILQLPSVKERVVASHSTGAPYTGAHRFALVVGVARYKLGGRGIQNLAYADSDAAAFHKAMLSPSGGNVPEKNVQFLLNEDATVENIRSAMAAIAARARAQDVIVVYLNMNGAYDPMDPDRKYLLAYDSDPEDMFNTAIPVASLPALLSGGEGSQHIVVLADTCHGNFAGTTGPDKVAPDNLVNLYLARAFSVDGQAALEASDIHQVSQEGARWNDAGAFTHFLIEGLSGAADTNNDGTVTTQELFSYVQMKVSEATMDGQLPIAAVGHGGNVALAGFGTARQAH